MTGPTPLEDPTERSPRPTREQVDAALRRAEHGGGKTPPLTTDVLAAEVRALRAEVERDDLARRAARLWADAWQHRHDAPDDQQAERGDQLEAALDALAAAYGIEVTR